MSSPPRNAQIRRFGNFGPFELKFSQNVRSQKVNWQCNNFGPKISITPKNGQKLRNAQIRHFGNFGPFGLKFSENVRNQKVNWRVIISGRKNVNPTKKRPNKALWKFWSIRANSRNGLKCCNSGTVKVVSLFW